MRMWCRSNPKKDNKKIVVQAKLYQDKVGIKAIQEVVSAKYYYGAGETWAITNNYFTNPAIKLDVILIDREELVKWITDENQDALKTQ